jgi:hypothetical protein
MPTSRAVDAGAGGADAGLWSDMGAANRERFDDAHQCRATSMPVGSRIDRASRAGLADSPTRQESAKPRGSRQKMPADTMATLAVHQPTSSSRTGFPIVAIAAKLARAPS